MADKDNFNNNTPEDILTEIDFMEFLDDLTDAVPAQGEAQSKGEALESDLDGLYDEIVGSGPETIVPKTMSELLGNDEGEKAESLEDLWMNPEEYFDGDIPVVSLDSEEKPDIPEEAFFAPEETAAESSPEADLAKDDIFSMIDMLKSDSDGLGFGDILSEIESNSNIAPVEADVSAASQLVTSPEAYEETVFGWSDELPEEPDEGTEISFVHEEEPSDNDVPDFAQPEDYENELARILSNPVISEILPEEPEEDKSSENFVIDIPDDGNDYEAAASQSDRLYESEPMAGTISYFTQEEFEKKIEEQSANAEGDAAQEAEKGSKGDLARKIILPISIITIIVCSAILANTYIIQPLLFQKANSEVVEQMVANENSTDVIDDSYAKDFPDVEFPKGLLAKYAQLYAANDDLRGWIKIPGFDIEFPVVQGKDNEYYLKKDVYGKYTMYGVPFFDYRMTDFRNLHMNNTIYGHNMRSDDFIFGMLENYRTIEGFEIAPVIECDTIYGDFNWFVYAVFITNSDPSDDNGYVFPYNFVDVSGDKFESYIDEIDKRKLYTTGVDVQAGDKLLTLSTCSYDFDGARLVVVARLQREGESISFDTSRAYENPNPKYPQAWYNANKGKENIYANDPRW